MATREWFDNHCNLAWHQSTFQPNKIVPRLKLRRLRLWTLNIIIWLLLNYLSCLVTFTRNCGFLSFILTSSVSIFISDIPFAWFGRWDTWNPKIITELTFQGSRAQQPRSQLNKIYLEQENITWWDKMVPTPLVNTLK